MTAPLLLDAGALPVELQVSGVDAAGAVDRSYALSSSASVITLAGSVEILLRTAGELLLSPIFHWTAAERIDGAEVLLVVTDGGLSGTALSILNVVGQHLLLQAPVGAIQQLLKGQPTELSLAAVDALGAIDVNYRWSSSGTVMSSEGVSALRSYSSSSLTVVLSELHSGARPTLVATDRGLSQTTTLRLRSRVLAVALSFLEPPLNSADVFTLQASGLSSAGGFSATVPTAVRWATNAAGSQLELEVVGQDAAGVPVYAPLWSWLIEVATPDTLLLLRHTVEELSVWLIPEAGGEYVTVTLTGAELRGELELIP